MADGALNLTISDYAAARLAEKATAMGIAPEALAAEILARLLDEPEAGGRFATRAEDYDGPHVELEDALSVFDHELERRLASRAE